MSSARHLHSFGQYSLDCAAGELRTAQRKIPLSSKQLQALKLLVLAKGEMVSKKQFQASLWHDSFVEEGNLTQTIFVLRRILGRFQTDLEFIETVPRKGYRLNPLALTSHRGLEKQGADLLPAGSSKHSDGGAYEALVNSIEEYAIYMLDCGGRVRSWNAGAKKNKGYKEEEVLGQHFSMFFTPEDIEDCVPDKSLKLALKNGQCIGEGWRLRKNGERFWASFVLTAMRDSKHRLVGFSKVVRDISLRKRQEENLQRMEAVVRRDRDRLRGAAESSMDAFYICEALRDKTGEIEDFVFTYLNSNVVKMVSLPREVLLNGRMCELFPMNRKEGLFQAYKAVVESGEPYVAEFAVNAEHVRSEWVRVQAVKLEDGLAITASDITQRKHSEAQILHLAHHDPLTGLLNRGMLDDHLLQAAERVKRYGGAFGVCLVDLDDFKFINDHFGHRVGDLVLKEVAARISRSVRAVDSVFRIGGDEFLVLLSDGKGRTDFKDVCKKVAEAFSDTMFIEAEGLKCGASLGLSVYPDDSTDAQVLLSLADKAMYKAKAERRSLSGEPGLLSNQ